MQNSPSKPFGTLRASPGACLVVLCVVSTSGCSMLSTRDTMFSDYDDTRRQIENPLAEDNEEGEGIFRPEGVTAEKGKGDDFLQRLGLRAKRRKDVELARSLFAKGEELYNQAIALQGPARADTFREAAENFKAAAENWRSSSLEQEALIWAAESHFFAEDYYQAERLYAQLIKEYPRNPYLDRVDSRRFEIADYWLQTDAVNHKPFVVLNVSDPKYPWNDVGGHGKRVLEKMRLDNPTGKVSDDATMRLAVEDFQKGKFESAADTFADLRLTFPDSEHQFNAQFLEMQSLLESYQGADYSSIPLTEAQQRVEQMVKQFPKEAAERKEELNKAYSKIRFQLAERIWEQAEYRTRRSENGSAKFHYNRILKEFSDTPFAAEAQAMLTKLGGQPDDPPQRFQSLVWLFGGDNDDRPWLKDVPAAQ